MKTSSCGLIHPKKQHKTPASSRENATVIVPPIPMASASLSMLASSPHAASPLASPASPTPRISQTLAVPKSFIGLRRSFTPRSSRIGSAPGSSRRSFVVNAVRYIGLFIVNCWLLISLSRVYLDLNLMFFGYNSIDCLILFGFFWL